MLPSIKRGTLIVAEGLDLPSACDLKTLPFCAGWRAVMNVEGNGLDKRFSEIGWTCFQKASPGSVNMIGFGTAHTLIKAFQKIVRDSGAVKFNCIEITHAIQKNFMGLSYVYLASRARNIKQRLW
jgi:hypothetical protein